MNNSEYLFYRKTKRTVKYKLRRRTEIMLRMIKKFKGESELSVLDIGAADGHMLASLRDNLNDGTFLGIEPSFEMISSRDVRDLQIVQAVGESLPFKSNIFDVVTAASVVDHLGKPELFMKECRRILKKQGIVVISLVAPFYDKLAVAFRIKDDDHPRHFTEATIAEFLEREGFRVLQASRFALPLFGMAFEEFIEKTLNFFRIFWPMFYIISVGRKETDMRSR